LQFKTLVTSDGEAVILWQSIDPEVVSAFKENQSDLGKGGPSATAVQQPCDVSTEFEDLKAGVKVAIKNDTDVTNEVLKEALKKYWFDLDIYLKSICTSYSENPKPLPSSMKDKIFRGLEIIVYVMQNGYMTPSKARQGFTRVGFHTTERLEDPILGYENSTVDFDIIMRQCYKAISTETVAYIKLHAPELIRCFHVKGKLKRADYEAVGIWQRLENENFIVLNRDDKVIWQQHAQLMTHNETVAIWTQYRLGRDPITLAANAAIAAATRAAEKLTEANLKAAQRIINAKAKADAKKNEKELERIRVASLTGNDKVEHEQTVTRNKITNKEIN
jgi:hypothetical protein